MNPNDIFDFDTDLLEPEEARRYWEMVAYLTKLRPEDDTRMLIEMPVLMSKVTLRHIRLLSADTEMKKQAMNTRADALELKMARLEKTIVDHTAIVDDSKWQLQTQSFSRMLMQDITDIIRAEVRIFLKGCRADSKQ